MMTRLFGEPTCHNMSDMGGTEIPTASASGTAGKPLDATGPMYRGSIPGNFDAVGTSPSGVGSCSSGAGIPLRGMDSAASPSDPVREEESGIGPQVMTDQRAFTDAWLNRYNGCGNTRPYVPIPLEYYEEMQYLSNEEFGELIRIMMWYCISGEVLPVRGALCHYITRVIDRQKRYYIEWASLSSKRSAAGKMGAAKRWNKNSEL